MATLRLPRWCGGKESTCQCRIHKRRRFDLWVGKIPWLGKLVSVFWWVELDFFSLECNEVSSNEL